MPNYRYQQYLVTDDIRRVESWDLIPIRLLSYETTRYYFPSVPGDTEGTILKEDDRLIMEQIFKIRHDELISHAATHSFFSPVLRSYGASPEEEVRIIRQVCALARSMALPIVGTIVLFVMDVTVVDVDEHQELWETLDLYGEEDHEDIDIDMDMEEDQSQTIKTVPATKSSIDKLEKVGVDRLQDCSICLDELSIGLQVVRMPCSHIFHSNCIVKWLERSCLCPLCRFQMPCVD